MLAVSMLWGVYSYLSSVDIGHYVIGDSYQTFLFDDHANWNLCSNTYDIRSLSDSVNYSVDP